jgi:methionyl-tRNA formyltransferase
MNQPKIIFIGTSQFAVPALENLIKNDYNIISVITAPDKPVGRKQTITPLPVKQTALKYKLPILQPEKISEISSKIATLAPDLIIVAAYGQLISKSILDIPRLGCLNLHPSLLPKYRGPSPIQTAILNGDKTTGVTIILMDEKIDHGPIISQKEITIASDENYQTLEKKLAETAADFLIEILPRYIQGEIKPQTQDESKASYTKTLTRQDGQIDWSKSAQEIERMVRAFYPWPGAWTYFNSQRVKILKAKAIEKKEIVDAKKELILPTGEGFLLIEILQPAGKKPMTGQEFFRGHPKMEI